MEGFKCTLCEKNYKSKESFLAHINKHNDDKPHFCSDCPAKFFSQSTLITHKKVHTGVLKLECPNCYLVISSKKNLKRHIERKHIKKSDEVKKEEEIVKKDYSCHLCSGQFIKYNNLKRHLQNIHNDNTPIPKRERNGSMLKKFICHICSSRFVIDGSLKRHLKNLHNEVIQSRVKPEKKAKTKRISIKKRKEEPEIKSEQKGYSIDQTLDFSFLCRRALFASSVLTMILYFQYRHVRMKEIYKRHLKVLKDRRQDQDNYFKTFDHTEVMNNDKLSKQTVKNLSKQCQFCGKHFKFRNSMLKHERKHLGKRFSCKCGKMFTDSYNFKSHSCSNERFLCPDCGKDFPSQLCLKHHQNDSHIKISVGFCYRCGKEYYNERPFKRHLKKQSCRRLKAIALNRTCDQCNKVFSKPANLRAHVKHHHQKIRPFKCFSCDKGFIDQRNLNAHYQKQQCVGGRFMLLTES